MNLVRQLYVRAPIASVLAVALISLLAVVLIKSPSGHSRAAVPAMMVSPLPTPVPTSTEVLGTATPTWTPGGPTATPSSTRPPTGTRRPTVTRTSTPTGVRTIIPTNTRRIVPTPVPTARLNSTPCPVSFSDARSSDWYFVPVRWLVCNNIASGYEDNTFRPNNNITRAQVAKIVVLVNGWPLISPQVPRFSDVLNGSAFYGYVETAVAHEIILGYPDDTFRPDNYSTRGELSRIVVLARGWPLIRPDTPTFKDVPASSPFYPYIETALNHGIVSGYSNGTFHPDNTATRAQLAKVILRAFGG